MLIKVTSLGRINDVQYEAVWDSHDKHLQDTMDMAVERMLNSGQRDCELYYGPMRLRIKPRNKRSFNGES